MGHCWMGRNSHSDRTAVPGQKMYLPRQEALILESVSGSVKCGTASSRTKWISHLIVLSCKKKRKLIKYNHKRSMVAGETVARGYVLFQ